MKKIFSIAAISVLFSLSVFADGGMEAGGKTCTNCFVNPTSQVEVTKETSKTLTETTNEYFSKIVNYFIEIAY